MCRDVLLRQVRIGVAIIVMIALLLRIDPVIIYIVQNIDFVDVASIKLRNRNGGVCVSLKNVVIGQFQIGIGFIVAVVYSNIMEIGVDYMRDPEIRPGGVEDQDRFSESAGSARSGNDIGAEAR